jgi:hypothetical protein
MIMANALAVMAKGQKNSIASNVTAQVKKQFIAISVIALAPLQGVAVCVKVQAHTPYPQSLVFLAKEHDYGILKRVFAVRGAVSLLKKWNAENATEVVNFQPVVINAAEKANFVLNAINVKVVVMWKSVAVSAVVQGGIHSKRTTILFYTANFLPLK